MSLREPCIFKIHFFSEDELASCGKAAEEVKRALKLGPIDKDPTSQLQDFLKQAGETRRVVPTGQASNDFQDTACEFVSDMYRFKVRYYPREKDQGDPGGILVLVTAMKSNLPDVTMGWKELAREFPVNLPGGLLEPITVYYAVSDKEFTDQELVYLDVWSREISAIEDPGIANQAQGGPDVSPGVLKMAPLRSGNLYKLGPFEKYLLFSSKERESEASLFATLSLPLLDIYFYSGDLRVQDKEKRLDAARKHAGEVSERIKNKLNDYSSRGFGSITSEAERMDVFEIAKDLWLLNNDRLHILNLVEMVDMALCNFRDLKERLLANKHDTEEIFSQKERLLELQKAQLQARATHLHNIFESGRVVLDSIEDHMELEYTRELKESNKKALSLQSAAFLIEFAIVFYYFLGSWHYILGERFYEFPVYARFGCATIIASLLCAGTHLFAKWRLTKKEYYLYGLLCLLLPFVFTLGYIVRHALMLDKFRH